MSPRRSDPRAAVFAPFFRGDKSRTRQTGGSGLGLTLAQRIVEAHGGTIALQSQPERGTTVTISLPLDAKAGGLLERGAGSEGVIAPR